MSSSLTCVAVPPSIGTTNKLAGRLRRGWLGCASMNVARKAIERPDGESTGQSYVAMQSVSQLTLGVSCRMIRCGFAPSPSATKIASSRR
jgi:hypothetical protein